MAKAHRGVVTFEGEDGGTTYVLKFGTNAICLMQEKLGRSLGEILEGLKDEKNTDMSVIRTMVLCALIQPKDATPEMAGDLIDDVGLKRITTAFGAVFGEEESAANPPGASNGDNSA